ncbi:NDP-hexose 2,3-dehydratase family protein [Crossiella cryophila]|uniref:Oxidase EvaA n=1 Tax=Crossiella cryophila TaxID=43355 RepID=A0A7W7CC88_9PSEU|nr:NDP-hexose 2,3-dehydratase family protein [Crossiella cryophila]MBB4678463.1 oxidase EvaA [Crossiella cryophila]
MTAAGLQLREDSGLAARLARSAAVTGEGACLRTEEVAGWLRARVLANRYRVGEIPFAALEGWSFQRDSGDLSHRSGRFFRVAGLHVRTEQGHFPEWQQPIIDQPEIGILGFLVKEFDGVPHFLTQAKMEPGNPHLVQLAPTVQATRSNYTRVHQGAPVRFLEHFRQPRAGTVVTDVLQSEHGAWFLRKANQNVIVETTAEVPPHEDFRWLTLGQLGELLRQDNVVNMDARTVLGCAPVHSGSTALHSDAQVRSWFGRERSRHQVRTDLIPLARVKGWRRDAHAIEHEHGRYFRVKAYAVEASNREVPAWTQPLLEPVGQGVVAFLTRRLSGVPHLLARARVEGGFATTVELGPTVQCIPANYRHLPPGERPAFLDIVQSAEPGQVRYAAVHSEEGGRFRHAESRYLVIDAEVDAPPGFFWVTPGQLTALAQHPHYVNVSARTLLAVVNSAGVRL